MRSHKATLLLIACFLMTVLSGILRGRIDQRWGVSEAIQEASSKLNQLPKVMGNWVLDEEGFQELSEPTVKMLRCQGNVVATYHHRITKQHVDIVFMVGPAGPLAQHTPEVCYGASNYRQEEDRKPASITDLKGETHEFAVSGFRANSTGGMPLRVYYSWNRDGTWTAPSSPRTAFAGTAMLYKLQVSTAAPGDNTGLLDAGQLFLRDCLPTLKAICN